ncbi:MAG: glycosyltransferase, partial [Planctomycetales bacterium]|nr:glycosyltransferase [Planctomycetales bacterium]
MIRLYIPFYSDKELLKLTIASAQRQTAADVDVTILDDCSAEISGRDDLDLDADANVKYRRNPVNLGMVGNWNQALEGDAGLAAIVHADDLLAPDYCQVMLDAAQAHGDAALYFCKANVIDQQGRPVFSLPDFVKRLLFRHRGPATLVGEHGAAALLRGNFIFCPTVAYNLKNLGDIRFDPRWRMVQDLDLLLRVLESGRSIVGVPTAAYHYRRHQQNATVQYTRNLLRFREENQLYLEAAARYRERGWLRAARVARRRTIVKLNLAYCTLRDALALRMG